VEFPDFCWRTSPSLRSDSPEVTLSGFAGGETWPLPPPVFVSYGHGGFVIIIGDLLVAVE
jgi:hypothetical protein